MRWAEERNSNNIAFTKHIRSIYNAEDNFKISSRKLDDCLENTMATSRGRLSVHENSFTQETSCFAMIPL